MRQFNVNRRMLSIILCIVLICTFTLSIAYAALSAVLTINGNAEVVASNWNIHLDNPRVSSGSVTKTLPVISGNTMTFSSSLVDPGDYYEFTVDVVNDGTIDAMIDSVVVTPTLTDAQKKYLRYEVTYQNGESISTKQTLKKGSLMPIKVRVEFRNDINPSDLPSTSTNLSHKVTLVYSQSDNTGSSVTNDGVSIVYASGNINDIGTIVTIGTEQFYVIGTEGDNVKLFAMYNLNVGNVCTGSDTSTCSAIENPTGIQDSGSPGALYDSNNAIIYPVTGSTIFSSAVYWYGSSTIAANNYNAYSSSSTLYGYNENYKIYLEGIGAIIQEVRPITFEEVTSLLNCTSSQCEDVSNWIYSTSYWVGKCSNAQPNLIYGVYSRGIHNFYYFNMPNLFGVRPVIVIPRNSVVEKDTIEFRIQGETCQAEEGMTWGEWINSSYNTTGVYELYGVVYSKYDLPIGPDGECGMLVDDVIIPSTNYSETYEQC